MTLKQIKWNIKSERCGNFSAIDSVKQQVTWKEEKVLCPKCHIWSKSRARLLSTSCWQLVVVHFICQCPQNQLSPSVVITSHRFHHMSLLVMRRHGDFGEFRRPAEGGALSHNCCSNNRKQWFLLKERLGLDVQKTRAVACLRPMKAQRPHPVITMHLPRLSCCLLLRSRGHHSLTLSVGAGSGDKRQVLHGHSRRASLKGCSSAITHMYI